MDARAAGGPAVADPWMPTARGAVFPLLGPAAADVDFRAVAEGLAKACRFAGQLAAFYSVAQHSVVVADMLPPEARPYGLLHDAHEAFVGDIPTPVEEALRRLGAGDAVGRLKAGLDAAIFPAAGLAWPLPANIAYMVRCADLTALATERRDLLAAGPAWGRDLPPPLARVITPWPWHRALDAYVDRLRRWLPAAIV